MFLACFQEEMHWTLTKLDNWRDHGLGLVTKSCSPKLREESGAMARAAMGETPDMRERGEIAQKKGREEGGKGWNFWPPTYVTDGPYGRRILSMITGRR